MTIPTVTEPHNFERLPEVFLVAMGGLTVRFGQLEHLLATVIRRATGEPWDEVLARLGTDLKPREKLLQESRRCFVGWATSSLDAVEAQMRIGKFDKIRNDIKDALDRRDELTHCAWGIDTRGNIRATRRGQPMLIDGHPAGLQHIEQTTEELWVCFTKLNRLSRYPQMVRRDIINDLTSYIRVTDPMACSATAASYAMFDGVKTDD